MFLPLSRVSLKSLIGRNIFGVAVTLGEFGPDFENASPRRLFGFVKAQRIPDPARV